MNKSQVTKSMAAAGIAGRVSGKGEAWEVDVLDEAAVTAFRAAVADVGAVKNAFGTWTLRPMAQKGLAFGTLDSAEQGSLFGGAR